MPTFQIRIVNSDFESCNEMEASDLTDVRSRAMRGALAIGADEICRGNPFFGAEVQIEDEGVVKERLMIGMGQSPLK